MWILAVGVRPGAALQPVPGVLGGAARLRPVERGMAAALRPTLLQVGLDRFPVAVAVHHAGLPAVAVRAPVLLVVALLVLGIHACLLGKVQSPRGRRKETGGVSIQTVSGGRAVAGRRGDANRAPP